MKKAIFLFKKLKTILNRIRKHALFGRKFLTFAHVPRLEKLYLWPACRDDASLYRDVITDAACQESQSGLLKRGCIVKTTVFVFLYNPGNWVSLRGFGLDWCAPRASKPLLILRVILIEKGTLFRDFPQNRGPFCTMFAWGTPLHANKTEIFKKMWDFFGFVLFICLFVFLLLFCFNLAFFGGLSLMWNSVKSLFRSVFPWRKVKLVLWEYFDTYIHTRVHLIYIECLPLLMSKILVPWV